MGSKRSMHGLTLIELVIAMVILFFTSMALLEFFDNSIRVELKNRDRTTAVKLAQKILEQQIYNNSAEIDDTSFMYIPENPHFIYKLTTNGIYVIDPSTTPPNLKLYVKEVKVVVRGPLDDSGLPIPRTQSIFLKVWRPNHVPSM